jgi:DNA primase
MLTTESIDKIRNVNISEVIGHYIKLKKKGTNFSANCPFHDEKSPSFVVNDIKGIYKCFGCGKGGDAIGFVMDKDKKTFQEACEQIAEICSVELEYEVYEKTEQEQERLSAAALQEQVLNFVVPAYRSELFKLDDDHPAKKWLYDRGLTDEMIDEWEIGWSPNEWHYITPMLINKGWFEPAHKMGIIRRSNNDSNYDGYRSRIIFPITDKHGRFIGLGGRYIRIDDNDAKDIPKYINPTDCEIYNKSTVLYGLKQARKSIQETGHAYITEGYMDVVSPHRAGGRNVVATCGTAFTDQQMRLLKRHTSNVISWRDNDQAGIKSTISILPKLLQNEFSVHIAKYDGKDPDEYVQALPVTWSIKTKQQEEIWKAPQKMDAVLWFNDLTWRNIEEVHERVKAKSQILDLIANIQGEMIRNYYFDIVTKANGWKLSDTKKEFKSITDSRSFSHDDDDDQGDPGSVIKFDKWVDEAQKEEIFSKGFISVNRKEKGRSMVGYYTYSPNGKTEITNFLVKPLFHVFAGADSRYLMEIYNGYKNGVLDLPARKITSIEQFQGETVGYGNFIIFGEKGKWLRIVSELLQSFPLCKEIQNPGWHVKGFFAFVDKVYVPGEGLQSMDEWGIFKHNDNNWLMAASCKAYEDAINTDKDDFVNYRYLTYKQSPVDFQTWSSQMSMVYLQKGITAIAYVVITLFRDIVFNVDNNFPHLYGYGEPSSGKSKWAESITAIFYFKRAAFNLNSGTDFAFNSYFSMNVNCPAHLNELDIQVIKQEWFQALKGAYDGEGRERGKMTGGRNSTEITKIKGSLILTGQYLVTADDNSLVTRSLIEPFSTRDDLTEDDKLAYDKLKSWESLGMSSMLIELLQHRKLFEDSYREQFNNQLSEWRKKKDEARNLNQRILQNWAHLCTGYRLVSSLITLPQPAEQFAEYCYGQAVKWSQFIRSSDTLSEFWRTLEFLVNEQKVIEGWDFIVSEEVKVTVRANNKTETDVSLEKPTKILFLRLNNAHKLFQAAYRTRTGKEAMSFENMLHYFSSRKYYVGAVKQKKFKRYINVTEESSHPVGYSSEMGLRTGKKAEEHNTSCYAFIYEDLDINIKSEPETPETLPF